MSSLLYKPSIVYQLSHVSFEIFTLCSPSSDYSSENPLMYRFLRVSSNLGISVKDDFLGVLLVEPLNHRLSG